MKHVGRFFALVVVALSLSSCFLDKNEGSAEERNHYTLKYVNQFAFNVMNVYYLWIDEIRENLKGWMSDDDPKAKVLEVRYKDSAGKDIDKWTQVTDDYESFVRSIEGVSTTYGYEFTLFYTSAAKEFISVAVTFVYADSPAEKAGLKRGDIILKADGEPIPTDKYKEIINGKLVNSSHCRLSLSDGRSVEMDAVEMYCNPVHIAKVFDCGAKKVGYLHFTAFTLEACLDLVKVCNEFKAQGISELILDMRYNGGGYVETEEVLASMLAPAAKVASGDVFMTEVYNDILTEAWGESETITHFRNRFKIGGKTIDTSESNIGINNIYAIMTGGSASASEAIICGLKPFVDITIVGQQSYGKYCSGIIIEGAGWYETFKDDLTVREYKNGVKYAANWGLYVMIGRYADRDGYTGCMPNGFAPDVEVADAPLDGYQLGDPNETMLKAALTLAGYPYEPELKSVKKKPAPEIEGPAYPKRESFGVFLHQKTI